MTERRHESENLEDYEVLDSSDTLAGPPGDDPLDRGVATPERWTASIRSGGTAEEQDEGESLDSLLAEEQPDVSAEDYDADAGEAVGLDAGIDSGGATAEEAAVHVLDEEDNSVEPTGEEQ